MTALQLLLWINAALLVQIAVGFGVFAWRRRAAAAAPPVPTSAPARSKDKNSAWPGWRKFRVARRVFEDAAQTQCSFHLEPVDGQALPPFKPGQFLTFAFDIGAASPRDGGAPATVTRCYSLSDRPAPTHYRITVKRVPAPAGQPRLAPGVASGHLHDHVHEGDVLDVKAPAGHFFIDPDPALPAVLVAGGIGITPMMSMLRWCLAEQPGRSLHLFYGVRHRGEHAFKALLEDLAAAHPALDLHVVYSRPGPEDVSGRDFRHAGHVDIDLLRRELPHGRHAFYLCGPGALMETLVPALLAWGVPPSDLHFEAFGPASVKLPSDVSGAAAATESLPPAEFEIAFRRSGRTLVWDGSDNNLLAMAERHGLQLDSGCRAGSCGTCETRLNSGTVRYAHAPDHDAAPGHCLPCLALPTSPLVLEA